MQRPHGTWRIMRSESVPGRAGLLSLGGNPLAQLHQVGNSGLQTADRRAKHGGAPPRGDVMLRVGFAISGPFRHDVPCPFRRYSMVLPMPHKVASASAWSIRHFSVSRAPQYSPRRVQHNATGSRPADGSDAAGEAMNLFRLTKIEY